MGILIAAAIATLASLLTLGGVIAWRSDRAERWPLILLLVSQLPLSPLIHFGLRVPLDVWLAQSVDWRTARFVTFAMRPIIEESLKLWPLLIPYVWRTTTTQTRIWRAMAIGLGFGIGESWLLAAITYFGNPTVANYGLLDLTGFINERVMVCVIHGTLTLIALHRFGTGIVIAIGLHLAGNLPFYLQEISAFGIPTPRWSWFMRVWVVWYFAVMAMLPWLITGGDFHVIWLIFGDVTCPYCHFVYPRGTLSWGFRVVHNDHCPRCHAKNPR